MPPMLAAHEQFDFILGTDVIYEVLPHTLVCSSSLQCKIGLSPQPQCMHGRNHVKAVWRMTT